MENTLSSVSFTVNGEPVPWKRARAKTHKAKDDKSGKKKTTVHFFEDKKVSEYKKKIINAYKESGGKFFEKGTPLYCEIYFFIETPKSSSLKKKLSLICDERPTKRPDIDNLYKLIADALNGIAYHDDSQIVSLTLCKLWSLEPKVEIELREIKHE